MQLDVSSDSPETPQGSAGVGTVGASPAVERERRGATLWLWLSRPEQSNCLSVEMLDGIDAALGFAEQEAGIRSVVVAARGRVFCAGADLKYVERIAAQTGETGRSPMSAYLRRAGETFNRLEAFPKPVLAAVHGLVLAGGLELILCCDIVVATDAALIGDGHATFGFIPGGGGSVRLTRRVGASFAKYLMFSGEALPAARFLNTDLVAEVVADDQLIPTVERFTEIVGRRSAEGLRRMKMLAAASLDLNLADGLELELEEAAAHERGKDFREGITAFVEGRRPDFSER